jgi:hypothetical protein
MALDIGEWTVRVLEGGLPPLPERLEPGDAVPVAVWRGERYGAVLFVRLWRNGAVHSEWAITERASPGGPSRPPRDLLQRTCPRDKLIAATPLPWGHFVCSKSLGAEKCRAAEHPPTAEQAWGGAGWIDRAEADGADRVPMRRLHRRARGPGARHVTRARPRRPAARRRGYGAARLAGAAAAARPDDQPHRLRRHRAAELAQRRSQRWRRGGERV